MSDRVEYAGHTDWSSRGMRWVFSHPDGSVYERADPDEFAVYDDADSTTIPDAGAPQ